jgi:hypothetical protein
LLVKDYRYRTPSDEEIRDEAVRRLANYFDKETLECEPGQECVLAKQPAHRLAFRAEIEHTSMSGECQMLVHQGFAYFLVRWTPAAGPPAAHQELDRLAARFALLGDRPDWAQKSTRLFHGNRADYVLEDTQSLWQEWSPATDYDALADLALVARERKDGESMADTRTMVAATFVVLIMSGSGDDISKVMQSAGDYLLMQQKAVYPETKIEVVSDGEEGQAEAGKIGSFAGKLQPLHVENGENRHRYILLGVVRLTDHVLVVQGECAWSKRAVWAPLFEKLLSTLKPGTDAAHQAAAEGS